MLESIRVTSSEGEETEFYVIEQTQVGGNTYLLACDNNDILESDEQEDEEAEDEGSLWIFRQVKTGEDEVYYEIIEDEAELKAVARVFDAMLDDYDIEI